MLVLTISVKVMWSIPRFMSSVNSSSVVKTLSIVKSVAVMVAMLLLFPAVSVMTPSPIEIMVLVMSVAI